MNANDDKQTTSSSYLDEDDDLYSPPSVSDELEQIQNTLDEILAELKDHGRDWSVLVWIFFGALLVAGWSGSKLDRWTDRVWYSSHYDTPWENVNIQKRPLDCDFFHAPIGSKGCTYEKHPTIFADEQRRALMNAASTPEERDSDSRLPNSVVVSWEKKSD